MILHKFMYKLSTAIAKSGTTISVVWRYSTDEARLKPDTNYSRSRVKVSPYRRSAIARAEPDVSMLANYTGELLTTLTTLTLVTLTTLIILTILNIRILLTTPILPMISITYYIYVYGRLGAVIQRVTVNTTVVSTGPTRKNELFSFPSLW